MMLLWSNMMNEETNHEELQVLGAIMANIL